MALLIFTPSVGAPVAFSVSERAFENCNRRREVKIAKQPRGARMSAVQALGRDESLGIEGTVYPLWRGRSQSVEDIAALMENFTPVMVTTGKGEVLGRHLIISLDEAKTALLSDGQEQKNEWRCELVPVGRRIAIAA